MDGEQAGRQELARAAHSLLLQAALERQPDRAPEEGHPPGARGVAGADDVRHMERSGQVVGQEAHGLLDARIQGRQRPGLVAAAPQDRLFHNMMLPFITDML